MPPKPRTRLIMTGRSSKYQPHSSPRAVILVYSRQSGYPAQHWRHLHMLRLTPTRIAYRSASHHACKPSSCLLALGGCRNTTSHAEYPRCEYITTCRERWWCVCLPTSRPCLSMIHARATSGLISLHPRNEACMCRWVGVLSGIIRFREASVKAYENCALVYIFGVPVEAFGGQTGACV